VVRAGARHDRRRGAGAAEAAGLFMGGSIEIALTAVALALVVAAAAIAIGRLV
jgi:hypothetical protein